MSTTKNNSQDLAFAANAVEAATPSLAAQPTGFAAMPLNPLILKAVLEAGYNTPTPVQEQVIPHYLEGRDLMVSSQTGSGKTAAFMLPALHKLLEPTAQASGKFAKGPRMLVLSPTRELAMQITAATEKYGKYCKKITAVSVLGGTPYPVQNRMLSKPYDILVATPGRLIDQMSRGRIDFSRVEMLVLDEADRMLDMGFIEDVERISEAVPKTSQTLLFSATLDGRIASIAKNLLKNPLRIETASAQEKHANIEQRMHYVDDLSHKNRILDHLLRDTELNQAVVFTATKRHADELADDLNRQGHNAAALHGDMRQGARNQALSRMRNGRVRIMVATDVAARGIDVPGITHVINFDLPKQPEDYVHRIGRTGRAGSQGIAISLAASADQMQLKRIERFTGQPISVEVIAGLEPVKPLRNEFKKPGARKPGGFSKSFGNKTGGSGWGSKTGSSLSSKASNKTPSKFASSGVNKGFGSDAGSGFAKSGAHKPADKTSGGFANKKPFDAAKPWQKKTEGTSRTFTKRT